MIELKGITKIYDLGHMQITALKGIDLEISRGEFITIMGPSGSGKSTLLHILGILDEADEGSYLLEKNDLTTLSDKELSRIRNQNFGFIFQSFNLFNEFNALENVMFPLIQAGIPRAERRERAMSLLTTVGLDNRVGHYPNMLSGGEQQRVAIARSLAMDPTFILADEPTGNLPSEQGAEILAMLDDLNKKGVTVIMVTHDDKLGERGTRAVRMIDGEIVKDFRRD
ncbi:MAG: ABC transporter ATP-binding protein [Spirochaetales bacterium]|nr:ABC transporter ATP-binding protein [Spirochaetales bacterium]